jgi:polysaccharide pyruvyl transferase WcaK-like protein
MSGVLLAGDLAARDPGEEALLAAFARELPRWPLVLMSADAPSAQLRHGRPAVNPRHLRRLLGALRHCGVLVLGDGALRGAGRGERTRDVLAITLAAKALGRRVVLLGAGVGGLHRRLDRLRVGVLVRLCDLLVLRDSAAAAELMSAGAPGPFRVAADPTWCALDPVVPEVQRRDEVLVILDSQSAPIDSVVPARLAATLDRLAAQGLRVRLAPWRISRYGADDLDLAHAIASRVGSRARILLPPVNLAEARTQAAGVRIVLAMRLHALIVAASAGTPALALGDEPELVSLSRRLKQPTLPMGAAPGDVADAALALLHGPPPSARPVSAERENARQAFRLLRLVLDADRSDEDLDMAALPLVPAPAPAPADGQTDGRTYASTDAGQGVITR